MHRHWFSTTALADLLGVDDRAVQANTLYRCHDLVLFWKEVFFAHLRQRWSDLSGVRYEVLLYDLTSTYFECEVRGDETDPRRFGAAERIWVMDRGIPTEEILPQLRTAASGVRYLVGTPKGRLTRYEAALAEKPWHVVRPQLRVKLLPHDGELYVLAESAARARKERGIRRRRLKAVLATLGRTATPATTDSHLRSSLRMR